MPGNRITSEPAQPGGQQIGTSPFAPLQISSDLLSFLELVDQAELRQEAIRIGPIPMVLRCNQPNWLEAISLHSLRPWPEAPWLPIRVSLTCADQIQPEQVPKALHPASRLCDPGIFVQDGDLIALSTDSMLWVADLASGRFVRWSADPAELPEWEELKPLRFLLRTWALRHRACLLHAAAVAGPRAAALLVGPGGAGKSTTAFACAGQGGLRLLADDYCLAEQGVAGCTPCRVHPTYLIGNLAQASLDLLPQLHPLRQLKGVNAKFAVPLDSIPPHQTSAPLVALCTLERRGEGPTRLEPISRGEALRNLAPSTVMQIPGFNRETLAATTRILSQLTTYRLRIGRLSDVPSVLSELLEQAP